MGATRNVLEKNDKLGEEQMQSMDTNLEKVKLYVHLQLPEKCENGLEIHDKEVPLSIDFAEIAKGVFPEDQIPAYGFVSHIEVKNGLQTNSDKRRLSLSTESKSHGRVTASGGKSAVKNDDFINAGTILVMGDGVPAPPMECVYDASGFAAPQSIFSKYSSALETDYEANITQIPETSSYMYISSYNDTEKIQEQECDEQQLEISIDKTEAKYDWFLGLISKNKTRMSKEKPITMTKKPGKSHKEVYTFDIAAEDMDKLKSNAEEHIFTPMKKHLIALRKDVGNGLSTSFKLSAQMEQPCAGVASKNDDVTWPAETIMDVTLGVTLSYFAGNA